MSHLQRTLGGYRFTRIVKKEPSVRVQEYHPESGNKVIWVVWAPTLESFDTEITSDDLPGKLISATKTPLAEKTKEVALPKQPTPRSVKLTASGRPIYLVFEKAS